MPVFKRIYSVTETLLLLIKKSALNSESVRYYKRMHFPLKCIYAFVNHLGHALNMRDMKSTRVFFLPKIWNFEN